MSGPVHSWGLCRRALTAAALGIGAAGVLPGAGHAEWGEAQIASVDNVRLEQADGATVAVDVSGDGRWVVFQTRAANFFADDDPDAPGRLRMGGIFRFDRATGQIALVADGDEVDDETGDLLRRGATAPSVSDDGRFVSFSTAQPLAPQDDNDNVDVYVRDMATPLAPDRTTTGAYALVSARDGGDEPARYAPREVPLPGRNPGSAVFAGQSISGDGRYVAFRTTELASDLPDRAELDTPPGNVFVRDLVQKRTVLVSRGLDGAPAGGSLSPVTLSRDGSTVAWVGQNAPLQTRFVDGESTDNGQRYYLWRRWGELAARTRRITGLSDPDDPGCGPGGRVSNSPLDMGPCDGPLTDIDAGYSDISGRAPALSADGWTVAYLSGAGARPAQDVDVYLDVFTTSMRPGLSRKAATRAVTKGTTAANAIANGDVESVAISGDGSRLLLVTGRRQFLSPAPPLMTDQRVSDGGAELYAVDLAAGGAIRRVLLPGGSDLAGSVETNPALSADGRTIAFASSATNLVRGDANELTDAFAVSDVDVPAGTAPPAGLSADPIAVEITSVDDELSLAVSPQRDGTLLARVRVPGAGGLRLLARTRPASAPRGSRSSGRARARRARSRRAAAVRVRQVATARGSATGPSTVRLTLRLRGADRASVRRGTPLPVRVAVTFAPSDGSRPRTATATARFRVRPVVRSRARGVRGRGRRGGTGARRTPRVRNRKR